MAETRETVKLHPSVIQQAETVKSLRKKPRRNPAAAAEIARTILTQKRIPPEVIALARELAADDPGRMQLFPDEGAIVVWNSRQQRLAIARQQRARDWTQHHGTTPGEPDQENPGNQGTTSSHSHPTPSQDDQSNRKAKGSEHNR